jgi:hypothetical protein
VNVADVVQRQLEAYNARDLDRFVAAYSDQIRIFRMPSSEPSITGKTQLAEVYSKRFSVPFLHADILARIVMGNKVIDHERVRGIREVPVEAVAIYEVAADLIQKVWFFYPSEPFPLPDGVARSTS